MTQAQHIKATRGIGGSELPRAEQGVASELTIHLPRSPPSADGGAGRYFHPEDENTSEPTSRKGGLQELQQSDSEKQAQVKFFVTLEEDLVPWRALKRKERTDEFDFIRTQNCRASKGPIKRGRGRPRNGGESLRVTHPTRDLYS